MTSEVFSKDSYELSLFAVPLLLSSIMVLVLIIRVLFREGIRRDSVALVLLSTAIMVWLFSFFWMYCSTSWGVALWWAKVSYFGVPLIPAALYNFTVSVLRKYNRKKWLVWTGWLLSLLTSAIFIGTDIIIKEMRHFSWGYYPQYTLWSIPYLLFFAGFLGMSLYLLWKEYPLTKPQSTNRLRIQSFIIAFSIACVGTVDYLAKFGVSVYPFGYLAIFVAVVIIVRAVGRYRLVDITPRFAAESIINTMNDALLVLDAEGVIRLVNNSSVAMFGFTEQELLGRPVTSLMDTLCIDHDALLRAGGVRQHEISFRHPNNAVLALSLSLSVMTDENGQLLAIVCTARDITRLGQAEAELRKAYDKLELRVQERTAALAEANILLKREVETRRMTEESLMKSHDSLQAVIDSLDEIVYVADMETYDILLINKQARELFGKSEGGKCWQVFQQGQSGPCSFCSNNKLVGIDGQLLDRYVWELQNTVNKRWYECRDKAIRWIDGRTVRLEIAADITDRRKLEQEVLMTQKLESVGTLAGGIAHDFNNLLQAIIGNISLARLYAEPESKLYDRLLDAEKVSDQAKELSYRLLTFAKGGEPFRQLTRLTALIKESASLALSGSNIAINFDIADELNPVKIDEGQMKQVFLNLMVNAKEAMADGGKIWVRAGNVTVTAKDNLPVTGGDYIRISITDQGLGIPNESLSKIFDPYFTTKDIGSRKGMGLGLAVCHSIVKKHEGIITVESERGVGSTFHVYLPAGRTSPLAAQSETPLLKSERHRILVMDDDQRVRDIAEEMLRHLGYEVSLAQDGEEAIRIYEESLKTGRFFDLVILDLTVSGGMGGEKTLTKLQEIDSGVRAVVSSGYTDAPILKDFRDYGFVSAIAKPYKIEQLRDLLEQLCV